MGDKNSVLTKDGLKKLEEELSDLKINGRKEVAQKIKEARSQGDLSENAEYDAAKDEQAEIEARIATIENIIRNSTIIEAHTDKSTVALGDEVVVYDFEFDEDVTYTIVGSVEANPLEFKISNESPVGAGLLGHTVGEVLEIETPQGEVKLEIKEIK